MKKTFKKLLAFIICMTLLLGTAGVSFASENEPLSSGTINVITYNVDGLPIPSAFSSKNRNVPKATKQIGQVLNAGNFDLVCLQENFNFYLWLSSQMTNYDYRTLHDGGVPVGDGLNAFSKYPIYNVERVTWNESYGIFDEASDQLTPKGILAFTIEIEENVFIDVYNIHADGAEEEKSLAARRSNLMQVAEMINSRSKDRAVIVTGDFNSRMCREYDKLYDLLVYPAGLKDAWTEVEYDGNYFLDEDIINQNAGWSNWWGKWDSVDRVLYKSGGGVEIEALTHEYLYYRDADGASLSDHASAQVTLSYAVTDINTQHEEMNTEKFSLSSKVMNAVKKVIKALLLMLSQLPALILGEIEIIGYK